MLLGREQHFLGKKTANAKRSDGCSTAGAGWCHKRRPARQGSGMPIFCFSRLVVCSSDWLVQLWTFRAGGLSGTASLDHRTAVGIGSNS